MARYEDILKEIQGARSVPLEQRIPMPTTAKVSDASKLDRLKQTAKQEKQKQKETEGALRNYLQQSGIQTSNTRFSAPNVGQITNNMLKQTTLDPKQLTNPVYTDAYGNTTPNVFQASQSNALKYNQLMQTDEAKQKVEDIKKQVTKAGYAQYEYDKEAVNQDEIGWFDKSLGNITRGLGSLVDAGGEIYDEKGNSLRLPSRNELKSEKVNESYNTIVGKILGNATYEGTRILASTALNAAIPYAGAALYFGDMFDSSYNSARRDGYDGDKAVLYATLSTASEVIVGKLLGAATKGLTGGKSGAVDTAVKKAVSKLIGDNRFSDFIANATAEGLEEFVQEYIDGINKLATLDNSTNIEDYVDALTDKDTLTQALYSAGIGALTGGMLGGRVDTNGVKTVEDLVKQDKQKTSEPIQIDQNLQQRLSQPTQLPVQSYNTDLSNYKGTQLQTYQNAINSGLLNNNKNTHDFVDFVGKISKDKGITFNFTNNQALQDRNIDAQINGFIDENGITLNIDSNMALESVIGHEITHTLENMTNEYNELKNSFKTLLGDEYNTRLEQIKDLYKGVEGANYENELISDLAGEYLFTNEEFINNLSTEKPSLFKRIYQEIKYLWKMATGTEQEKQLAKTMRIYENAYRNAGKATATSMQYSLAPTQDNKGRNLTKEQQEFYKNVAPELRDEKGNLMTFYHGTPTGDFTIFKPGTYFSDRQEYASGYENTWASSISSGKVATNPKTYEVYLNITNPFTISNQTAKDIYINEYIKGGNSLYYDPYTDYTDTINNMDEIDWTEGEDLKEWLQENHPEYDGLILDEGGDGGYGEAEYRWRGKSYVPFSSEQIKNVDNTKPTSNPDIRYSLSNKNDGYTEEQREDIDKWKSKYVGMDSKKLDKEYDYANESYQEMKETAYKLEKEYKELQKTNDFIKTLQNYDFESEIQKRATEYADKIRYYNREMEKYFAQREAINEIMMGNVEDTRSVEQIVKDAEKHFGTTMNFKEAAYITLNGNALDFSGKNEGGTPGKRNLDHREINEIDTTMDGFIKQGNIRLKPEGNGFEVYTMPNSKQISKLYDYIYQANGEIYVDVIKDDGSYDTATYKAGTPARKIIGDLETYFETGKFPQKSEYADFYYSLSKKDGNLPKGQFRGKSVARDTNISTTQESALNVPANKPRKVLNPTEISNLKPENANTTPILPTTSTLSGDKSSRFLNNLNRTEMLSKESKNLINNANIGEYKSVTNEESLKNASEKLKKGGKAETERWFRNDPKNVNATDIAEGFILLNQYQEIAKNSNNAADKYQANQSMVEVAKKLRQIGTEAGQTLQAYTILSRMTPEGMVYYAQSELTDAYNEMIKNKSKQWIDQNRDRFELTPDETQFILDTMQEVSKMEDGYEKKVKLAEIQKLMTDKLPPEKGQKLKSWMRLSMLFNPKTQVRNIAGNALIAPVNSFGDIFASYADKLISKKTNVRTTGKTDVKAMLEGFKKGAYEATTDYKKGINTRDIEGNRFEIGDGKSFSDKNIIGKALNNTESLLNYVMDAGDRVFSEAAFENSLQNQLKLNNTTEVTQDMIDIARQESLSRTWNDNNNYTKFVLNVRSMLNKINVGTYGLGDVLIPFAKTPANLTKAIVDYSPVGFVNTLLKGQKLSRSLQNGQYTPQLQHEFVQSLGKATAGTMLYVLGTALAKAGVISGESDDDKDTQNFLKNTLGVSNYSIKLGGKSFTYDWAQPLAAPLSITANIVNRKDKEQALGEAILSNLDTASSVLLEQSFMQGINEVLNGNGGIVDGLINQVLSLPARAIPTLSKQIVDLTDSTQRTSFEYGKPVQSAINAAKAKIPGLSQTLAPVVDTMGREVERYGGKNNIFNVFLNPASVNTENISEAASEIYKIYQATGDKTIMPRVAPYYINSKGEKITLNSKQKAEFQTISGSIIEENMNDLINNQAYQILNDNEKASMINDLVNYAYNKARQEVLGIDMSNEYNKINEYVNDGGTPAEYYTNKEEINYAYTNPEKYSAIKQIASYNEYQTYNDTIKDIKEKYSTSNERKSAIINYVNGLPLNIPQKAMLIKMYYSSFKQYDNQIIEYVNSQDLTISQKSDILKEVGFTIKNGVVYK